MFIAAILKKDLASPLTTWSQKELVHTIVLEVAVYCNSIVDDELVDLGGPQNDHRKWHTFSVGFYIMWHYSSL